MPFVHSGFSQKNNIKPASYAVSMKPRYLPAITDVIKFYQWKTIIYIYDSDDGKNTLCISPSVIKRYRRSLSKELKSPFLFEILSLVFQNGGEIKISASVCVDRSSERLCSLVLFFYQLREDLLSCIEHEVKENAINESCLTFIYLQERDKTCHCSFSCLSLHSLFCCSSVTCIDITSNLINLNR